MVGTRLNIRAATRSGQSAELVHASVLRQHLRGVMEMSREEEGATRLSTKDQIGLLTVVAVTVAMGLFFAFQGVKTVVRQARSGSWPAVEATIVAPLQESDSNSQSLMVKYDYIVDGANYTSKWKHLGINVEDPQHYAKVLKDFAVGNHLDVYYDPIDPSQPVCHPSRHAVGFASAVASWPVGSWVCVAWFLRLPPRANPDSARPVGVVSSARVS